MPADPELEAAMTMMAEDARARGYEVMFCEYDGLRVPVLCELARRFAIVEDQQLSDDQMIALIDSMYLNLRRN